MGQVIKGWTEAMQLMVEGARDSIKRGWPPYGGNFLGTTPIGSMGRLYI